MVDIQIQMCYIMLTMIENTQIQTVRVTNTDSGKQVEATLDRYEPNKFMDVIMAGQRVRLTYNPDFGRVYVGNAYGMELTAHSRDIS